MMFWTCVFIIRFSHKTAGTHNSQRASGHAFSRTHASTLSHMWMLYSSEFAQHVECHCAWLGGQMEWIPAIGRMNERVLNNNQAIREEQPGRQISKWGCAATWTLNWHGQTCVTEREIGGGVMLGRHRKSHHFNAHRRWMKKSQYECEHTHACTDTQGHPRGDAHSLYMCISINVVFTFTLEKNRRDVLSQLQLEPFILYISNQIILKQ